MKQEFDPIQTWVHFCTKMFLHLQIFSHFLSLSASLAYMRSYKPNQNHNMIPKSLVELGIICSIFQTGPHRCVEQSLTLALSPLW